MGFSQVAMMFFLSTAAVSPAQAAKLSSKGPLPATSRQLARHEAEVKRLQQEVARQERASARASARLQQQDKTIADLHRRLQALDAHPAPARH
jgi:septal ring factor EnvC (AmiA/AmiB activator)